VQTVLVANKLYRFADPVAFYGATIVKMQTHIEPVAVLLSSNFDPDEKVLSKCPYWRNKFRHKDQKRKNAEKTHRNPRV
jgi:hypothetical protein